MAVALLGAGSAAGARPKAEPLLPELVLDIDDPVIAADVAGVPLRLRVDFDRRDTIELNPDAAARLPLRFEAGGGAEVGRVQVAERVAAARIRTGGVEIGRTVTVFDRPCCAGADGAVGPDLLPYAQVRFVRRGGDGTGTSLRLPLTRSSEGGLAVETVTPAGKVFVRFSLTYPAVLATASAGAILAKGYGGRLTGEGFRVSPAFGIERPARNVALARPAILAGFTVDTLPVRTADFSGGLKLPSEPAEPGDIVVRHRGAHPQPAWPSVLIGRERLDRCTELTFRRDPMELALRCNFAG